MVLLAFQAWMKEAIAHILGGGDGFVSLPSLDEIQVANGSIVVLSHPLMIDPMSALSEKSMEAVMLLVRD